MCAKANKITAATVVDHIKKHEGDIVLFLDAENLQSLCKLHHDSSKQKQEKTGIEHGCDPSGMPIDSNHHWR